MDRDGTKRVPLGSVPTLGTEGNEDENGGLVATKNGDIGTHRATRNP